MQATPCGTETTVTVARRRLDRALFEDLTAARGASTTTEKAALVGVHRATIYDWFNEFRGSLSQAETVAAGLGTTIDTLFPVVRDEAA